MNRVLIFFILTSAWTSSFGQDVKTILERYFQSIGGMENIENLKSSSFSYKSFGFYPKKDTSYIEKKQLLPGNHVIENYYRNGKLIHQSILNGDSLYYFFIDPFPRKAASNITHKEPISLDPSTEILRLYKSRDLKYSKADSLNGIEYQVLKTNYNPSYKKSNTTFYFDNQTGLLMARKTNDNVTYYKNYRKVNSISFPFVHEQYLNTLLLHKYVYEKVDFNIDLTPDDFSFTNKLEDIPPLRNLNSKYNKVEFVDSKYNNVSLNDLMNNFRGQRICKLPLFLSQSKV